MGSPHILLKQCFLTCACLLEAHGSGGLGPELAGPLRPPDALFEATWSGGSKCQLWGQNFGFTVDPSYSLKLADPTRINGKKKAIVSFRGLAKEQSL